MSRRPIHLVAVAALAACVVLLGARPAPGEIYIRVDNVKLLPDTPGQTVPVLLTTDAADRVAGCNFNVEIGGAGPDFGGVDGPRITGVDLVTGTIFDGNNRGQTNINSLGQLAMYSIVTEGGTVPAGGLLATLTIDTTGFTTPGTTWTLALGQTNNGPTNFAPDPAIITDCSIMLVPEPAAAALLGLGGLAMLIRRRPAKTPKA
jgi:hypothetical protein